jgi:hypothetical protein
MDPLHRAHQDERDRSPSHTADLFALGQLAVEPLCQQLASSLAGLTYEEAERRLQDFGLNLVARERKPTILEEIWGRARNPLNALLLTLAAVSYFIGDMRAAIVIVLMVLLAVGTAFVQEHRSNEAAARLRAMVKTTASVKRRAAAGDGDFALPSVPRALLPRAAPPWCGRSLFRHNSAGPLGVVRACRRGRKNYLAAEDGFALPVS